MMMHWECPLGGANLKLYEITPIYWPMAGVLLHSPNNSERAINSSDSLPKKPLRQLKELGSKHSISFLIQGTWVMRVTRDVSFHRSLNAAQQ